MGAFELVNFPKLGLKDVVAKIDTGAYSGALHATNIVEKTVNGQPVLTFWLLGREDLKGRCHKFHQKRVRSSNGLLEKRYIIETDIEIAEKNFPIAISLSNRSLMMKEVLIGRQFLRTHNFLVDVRQRAKYRYQVKD